MRRWLCTVVAAIAFGLPVWAGAFVPPGRPALLSYRLTPKEHSLAVDVTFIGDAHGTLTLDLPDEGMGEKSRWRFLGDFTIEGAAMMAPNPATRVLTYKTGAHVKLHYIVKSAYDGDVDGRGGNPYRGAIVTPQWFSSLGNFLFVTPHGRDAWPARFQWGPLPRGMAVASDLDHPGSKTTDEIVESTILGGTDVSVLERPVDGGRLTLAVRGHWTFDTAALADVMARTVSAQRAFWGHDVKGPYLVTLFQMAGAGSSGGTGRGDGFALYGTADTGKAIFERTIAHEHMHSWIPVRIGRLREGPEEPRDYWFSEGFTDFYTDRTLLKSGIWSPADFVADVNERLADYANSPVRNAPNAAIVRDFWTNYATQKLPYLRGFLLAFLWDARLRDAGKSNLDAVMFAARDRFAGAPRNSQPLAADNFIAAYQAQGFDLAADLKRFVEDGETIVLPPGLFGACAALNTITLAKFDPGFDRDKSAAAGVIAGVDPNGAAYAAGLRDGMKRIKRIGGKEGDSRVQLGYTILDAAGTQRDISWLPAGRETVTMQQVALASAACTGTPMGAADAH